MTEKLFGPELKPWEEPVDGRLSPSSYSATAVFGLVELAVETLHGGGYEITPSNVGELTKLFARVTVKAHVEFGSGGGWASALHTRLRGALRTALRVLPHPDVSDMPMDQDMRDWETDLLGLVRSITKTAAWLYALSPEQLEAR